MSREGLAGTGTLLIDGEAAGQMTSRGMFNVVISWSGLDIGLDRGTTVGDYPSPFIFTGGLSKVTVSLGDDQTLDHAAVGRTTMARE